MNPCGAIYLPQAQGQPNQRQHEGQSYYTNRENHKTVLWKIVPIFVLGSRNMVENGLSSFQIASPRIIAPNT